MAQAQTARSGDKIPPGLMKLMAALALAALSITAYASITDRPLVGAPHAAPVLQQCALTMIPGVKDPNAVTVLDQDGRQIVALANGGFIAVVLNGLSAERRKHRQPVDRIDVVLTRYANGRLNVSDPTTGWSAELQAFGAGNTAAFAPLLAD